MDRLRELFASLDFDALDLTERSDEDLGADLEAVRSALTDTELSVADKRQIVAFGKAAQAEMAFRSELSSDIEALLAEPAPEPKAKVADFKRPDDAAPVDEPEPEPEPEPEEAVLVAAGGTSRSPVGADAPTIGNAEELAHAMNSAYRDTSAPSNGSVRHRAVHRSWSTDQVLEDGKNGYGVIRAAFNAAQERARREVFDAQPIQAASGICGPLAPSYSFLQLASASAGIIDLPSVQATRGGVRLPQAVTAYDLRGEEAIGFDYTSADGAAGSRSKPAYTVSCPDISDFTVTAYATTLRFSNFQGQFFPEYTAHVTEVALAEHAHDVNTALIDAIIASADTVAYDANGATKLGDAWAQFTRQTTFHVWLYRDKYLTAQDLVLDVVLPWRAKGALIADVMARDSSRPEAAAFAIEAALAAFGREIGARFQWVYDYQLMTEAPGDFGSENYEFLVFPAGEITHLTGATLDLGVVRDSTRNAANEFDTWVETFDGIATAGYEIMRVTELVLCPNGATGARVTIECGTGS